MATPKPSRSDGRKRRATNYDLHPAGKKIKQESGTDEDNAQEDTVADDSHGAEDARGAVEQLAMPTSCL